MGLFDNLVESDDIEEQGDRVSSRFLKSGLYDFTVDLAYVDKSAGGAMSVNFIFKNKDKLTFKTTEYVTSGKEKGGLNYYTTKDGKKKYLPGFEKVNQICMLSIGKELSAVDTEEKVISLYNFDMKKEVPTKRQVLTELIGQDITLGVIEMTEDSYKDPTQSVTKNEIDKVFRTSDGLTMQEVKDQSESAYKGYWEAKNTDVVRDKRKQSKNTAKTDTPKPSSKLFG